MCPRLNEAADLANAGFEQLELVGEQSPQQPPSDHTVDISSSDQQHSEVSRCPLTAGEHEGRQPGRQREVTRRQLSDCDRLEIYTDQDEPPSAPRRRRHRAT